MARIDLSPGPDSYSNPSGQSDQIYGEDGNDQIFGNDGSDDLFGGNGNDYLHDVSTDGPDRLYGGQGDDTLFAGFGDSRDLADGGAGTDLIALDYRSFTLGGIRAVLGATMQVRDSSNARAITVQNCERISIFGTSFADTLSGGGLGDTLNGISGADTIRAGAGNDLVTVGQVSFGQFDVLGGLGNDTLAFYATAETAGIVADVTLRMTFTGFLKGSADQFEALFVETGSGADQVSGGGLADNITTNGGNDTVSGRQGNDRISLGFGSGTAFGGDGNDTILAYAQAGDSINAEGGTGNDYLDGGDGNDTLRGGDGNDTIRGRNAGSDVLYGGDGNDEIDLFTFSAASGAYGGVGNDTISVAITTTTGIIDGGTGTDVVEIVVAGDLASVALRVAAAGATFEVRRANGTLVEVLTGFEQMNVRGGSLADTISGGALGDALTGGSAGFSTVDNDLISGNNGNDTIDGFGGNDRVYGGAGNDLVYVGVGIDTVTGGVGRDTFYRQYTTTDDGLANTTRITDFVRGQDKIDLSNFDADLTDVDNDAFRFVGRAEFTDAGQIRYTTSGGVTTVLVRTNDNSIVDAHFTLNGTFNLTAADFIL